ncbi:MAG: hypothetical protein WCR42_04730 [bacterium]
MKIIRIWVFLIFLFGLSLQLSAQPYIQKPFKLKVYNADDLIKIWENKGLEALKKSVYPIDLVYLDKKYADKLIDIEFKSGFIERHPENNKYYIKNIPELTLEIANIFHNKKSYRKLFQYYCSVPKVFKSDTVYELYKYLDDYLGALVTHQSSSVVLRLVEDYNFWKNLIKTTPRIKYPKVKETPAGSEIDLSILLKFDKSELYNDPRYISLQIAGALNYINIKGFDRKLLDYLKSIQTESYKRDYSFTEQSNLGYEPFKPDYKTIKSKSPITSFKKDYKLIWKLIEKQGTYGKDSQIYELIFKRNLAYISITGSTWSTDYLVKIINKNAIAVAEISTTRFNPTFEDLDI